LAFAFSWVVTVPMVFLQGPPQWTVLATSAPTLAALVVSRITTGRFRFWTFAVDWTRLVCGSAAGAALVVTAYIVLPGIFTADPRKLNWSILASLHVFNYSTLLGGPIGEEVGWTGYAMARLEERFGAVPGVLLLGLLWSSWHLPLFLRPGFFSAPFWIYTLILVGLRLIIGACVNWSRFSIAVAIVMHASFNTVSRWLGGLFRDVQPQSSLPFELVLALGGLSVAAILVLGTRGRLGFSPEVGISQAIPPDSFRSTA
jgi:membrane protease YdiL (CAAX protease family)